MMSILRTFADRGDRAASEILLYGSRDWDSNYTFCEELEALACRGSI